MSCFRSRAKWIWALDALAFSVVIFGSACGASAKWIWALDAVAFSVVIFGTVRILARVGHCVPVQHPVSLQPIRQRLARVRASDCLLVRLRVR